MAGIKYLVDLDLTKNQLLNAVVQNLAVAPGNPKDGQIYWDTADKTLYAWKEYFPVPSTAPFGIWLDLGTTGVTDLAYTSSDTNGIVTSSAGTDATIPLATLVAGTNKAGLLSPSEKTKIALAVLTNQENLTASFISTSETLVDNSDTKLASQKATKSYIDNLVLTNGSLVFKDAYNADTNSPNLDSTPIAGIKKGWTYVVSVAGTFFTEPVDAGDMVIAKQNDPTTLSHWALINKNIPEVLTTLLVGFVVGENSTITSADSILVAFGKVQAQLNTKVSGSGTINQLAKFTSSGVVGNSVITESATGKIGINQPTPTESLDVVGNGKFSGSLSSKKLRVSGGELTTGIANIETNANTNYTLANAPINFAIGYLPSDNPYLQSYNAVNNASNKLDINPFGGNVIFGGNVGVNQPSPTEKLDVVGNGKFSGTVKASPATVSTELVTLGQLNSKTGKLVSVSASASLVSTFAIAHTFGTDVIANARFVSDNTVFLCEVIMTNNLVTFNVNTPIAANSVKFIIIG
jgi:hypothetical protein